MNFEEVLNVVCAVFNELEQPIDGWTEEIAEELISDNEDLSEEDIRELTLQYFEEE